MSIFKKSNKNKDKNKDKIENKNSIMNIMKTTDLTARPYPEQIYMPDGTVKTIDSLGNVTISGRIPLEYISPVTGKITTVGFNTNDSSTIFNTLNTFKFKDYVITKTTDKIIIQSNRGNFELDMNKLFDLLLELHILKGD